MADEPLDPTPRGDQPYQSLYRRYRPQLFSEVRGQPHVTEALRKAVRDERVAHAYLFSGPRGTGKTSTARILAMALNCAAPQDGEPDGTCPSCVEIRRGSSLDVHELDAASNRKLDEMRELLSRVALGTSGRWKVYIVDEVHQLTNDASSALLKTLEEPPAHVVFVLATTDPQKVLPTIRSRTQHYEFRLLGADVLGGLLRDVNERADLGIAPEAIDLVVRRGRGSARDALSVLDQVAAAGDVEDDTRLASDLVDAVADRDAGRVLATVAEAVSTGRDPRRLATDLLDHLRNGFLATQARGLVQLADDAVAEVEAQANRLGLAGLVRALEVIGEAAVDMRDAVDPRITLEVALVRLAAPKADEGTGALLRRLEQLEAQVAALTAAGSAASAPAGAFGGAAAEGSGAAGADRPPAVAPGIEGGEGPVERVAAGSAGASSGQGSPGPASAGASGPGPTGASEGPASAGAALTPAEAVGTGPTGGPPRRPGAAPALGRPRLAPGPPQPGRSRANGAPSRAPTPAPASASASASASGGSLPTRDELTKAWGDEVLPGLPPAVKVYVSSGRFVEVDGTTAVFALPDRGLLGRAQGRKGEMEAALAARFGRPVPVRFVLDGEPPPAAGGVPLPERLGAGDPSGDDPSDYDLDDLEDAGPALVSPEQRLLEAFPGAEEVTP